MFKTFVRHRLQQYVRKYFAKHPEVILVVVAGSVGKTSTKRALGTILNMRYRVRMHEGNHNADISAPLAILGIDYPGSLRSVGAWISVFRAARRRIRQPSDVNVIIQELGTDRPGDLATFASYLRPNIALVSAVTPEHMEFFQTLDAVAREELSVTKFSDFVLINRDDVSDEYASYLENPNMSTYGTTALAENCFEIRDFTPDTGYTGMVSSPLMAQPQQMQVQVVGEHSLRPIIGAIAAALKIGMAPDDIAEALKQIKPVPGRMNPLRGIGGTVILDDTYNSSPAAAEAALRTLYGFADAPQRIAVLGSMNELGSSSQVEHEALGRMCDGGLLAWVVTVGEEAEKHLAPAARQRGCQVRSFRSPIDAGAFVRSVSEPGAYILVKGSQGGIYLEECVKVLCDMTEDIELVRQTPEWMRIKNEFLSKYTTASSN